MKAVVCTLRSMDHRLPALRPPVMTALEQMAAMAKETHDAFVAAGFSERVATDLTVGLLKAG